MPRFVIEREMPQVGTMSLKDLQSASKLSCDVLAKLGASIQWVESYVTGDKIYCVYQAASEELIRRHAEMTGFPANRIERLVTMIDPTTAEGPA